LSSKTFVEEAFDRHGGRKCIAVFLPVGFASDGNVVVRASPYYDINADSPRKDSCVLKEGLWLVDSTIPKLKPLSNDYRVQRFGRIVP
jgi:hypothetical protein